MSDGNAAPNGATEEVDVNVKEIERLINTLIPDGDLVIEDITGGKHKLSKSLPGSVETRVLRAFKQFADQEPEAAKEIMASMSGLGSGAVSGVVSGIVDLLTNEAVLTLYNEAFALAHPSAMRRALENVKADEAAREYLPSEPVQPVASDLFSTAEVVRSLLPFGAAAAGKLLAGLAAVQGQ